jgi:lantibiotic modifying enzyme
MSFVAAQPPTKESDDTTGLAGAPLVSFRRAAYQLLAPETVAAFGVVVAESAYEEMADQLVSLLAQNCGPALRFELEVGSTGLPAGDWAEATSFDVSQAGWLGRLEALPGLAYVVGVLCEQWRRGVSEILARLQADMALLRRQLWDWADVGALTGYSGGAGDRHCGGRSVALLRFEHGQGLVYKPKELRHAVAFMDIVTFLNGHGLPLALPTRRIIQCDGYGWEERVEPRPVEDPAVFGRYYRRLGMIMRLEQFLEGRDAFADNLMAVGEHPVVVDLECLLYPRTHRPVAVSARRYPVLASIEDSVRRTSMPLQPWLFGTETTIKDLGCMSKAGDPVPETGLPALPLPPYRPWYGDTVADPNDYTAEVLAGFGEMQEALAANGEALAAADGPLGLFKGAWVRYIWRSTFDCYNMLSISTSPIALTDGVSREIVLAGVLRGAFRPHDEPEAREDITEMAEKEVAAFRILDVPLFGARTDSTTLFAFDGSEIEGHFEKCAWDLQQERVAGLATFDLDGQRAVLAACLEAAAGGADLPTPVPPPEERAHQRPLGRVTRTDRPPPDEQLLGMASDVAETLLEARASLGRGAGWVALTWYPFADLYEVEVAPADLLSGVAAPAVFLAEMFATTGDPRHWSAARDALEEAAELEQRPKLLHAGLRAFGTAPPTGGLFGAGAVVYASARSGPLLGDAGTLTVARQLVAVVGEAVRARHSYEDLPSGAAGALCNLLRLRSEAPVDAVDVDVLLAELIARASRAMLDPAPNIMPLPTLSRLPDLFPTGRDGIAMALARAMEMAPELVFDREALLSSLAVHRYATERRGGRLAQLSAAGSGYAQLDDKVLGPSRTCDPAARGSRELIAGAHEALVAWRVAGEERALATAAELVHALLARKRDTGSWMPDRRVDDRLSLSCLDGLPAVGMLALQMLSPNISPVSLLA